MDFLKSMAIAASGLRAQSSRMRVIAENIANADSTAQRAGGEPYRRKIRPSAPRSTAPSTCRPSGWGACSSTGATSAPNTSRRIRPPTATAMSNTRM